MAETKLKKLLHTGIESVSGGAGSALGLVAAGPMGAVAGGAFPALAEYALKGLLSEVADRPLSKRERWKVGTAAAHAVNRIYERLVAGEKPRQDGFFNSLDDDRSPAETVLEGVLTTSRFQWEERKIPYIANIYVNAAFSDHPPETINRVLALAERMSWRQYYILSLSARYKDLGLHYDWLLMGVPELPPKQEVLRQDLKDLYAGTMGLLTTNPLGPTFMGMLCIDLMGLMELPLGDIEKFFAVE